ncbi:MAG: phosphatidylserine decarboxylase [Lachnospiraceae bacterium]|nr:phosphatidylserine decarboxylase [Lachnospiraceae bacterium]
MKENASVTFLYHTLPGHLLLKLMMLLRIDRLIVCFLRSRLSNLIVPYFVKKNGIDLSRFAESSFATYRDLFLRHKKKIVFDGEETALVSPCDGYLSAYRIGEDTGFVIKGMRYTLRRLAGVCLGDASRFRGGCALVLRLSAADYHHYHYFDDCVQHAHHATGGKLHSVQPAALQTYPVFAENRRRSSVLSTAHFGRVIQIEVGAFVVGGIVNHHDAGHHARGEEKGHFDLSGSTIVLLFETDRVRLRKDMRRALARGEEVRVETGERIGSAKARDIMRAEAAKEHDGKGSGKVQ